MHAQAELPINMTTLVIGTADSARSIHCRYSTMQYSAILTILYKTIYQWNLRANIAQSANFKSSSIIVSYDTLSTVCKLPLEYNLNLSAAHAFRQSIRLFISQSVSQSLSQSVSQSLSQSDNTSVNQSINATQSIFHFSDIPADCPSFYNIFLLLLQQ